MTPVLKNKVMIHVEKMLIKDEVILYYIFINMDKIAVNNFQVFKLVISGLFHILARLLIKASFFKDLLPAGCAGCPDFVNCDI